MIKLIGAVVVLAVAALAVGMSGIGVSLALENQDSFCASCHTEPEVTYYQQSLQSNPVTLAAFHTEKQTTCIDCHSGGGLLGRSMGLAQGFDDLVRYYSGSYSKPAITTNPLGNDSCMKCHEEVVQTGRRRGNRASDGHYHAFFTRWEAVDPAAARCTSCHPAHPSGTANQQFMSQTRVTQACDQCHRETGEGGER